MIFLGLSKPGNNWVSREIDRRSGGRGYSHAFVWFDDLRLVFEAHSDFGVRFIDRPVGANEVLIPFPNLTPEREKAMLRKAATLAGNGYDFKGVAHFELPFVSEDPKKQYCSEAACMVGQAALYYPGAVPANVSPNDLSVLAME